MIASWAVVLTALVYLCLLFAIAHWGDTSGRRLMEGPARATIYALALAVYCTSWTFYGSVGLASRSGLDFLAIYIGPILVIGLFHPLVLRVVRIAKAQNITSIADFVAARYGKSERVAAIVSLIAVIGSIPYLALQLKAISASLGVFFNITEGVDLTRFPPFYGDLALIVSLVLAAFAVAFGTRHTDATEHQDGLVLAVSVESLVKLVAFLAVGTVVTMAFVEETESLAARAETSLATFLARTSDGTTYLTLTALAACAALLLPRQFHMAVVENRAIDDVRRAAWLFPLYLVLINLFVIPVAMAGLAEFPPGTVDRDMTVLALPLAMGNGTMALVAFIGGLSAATAMVIVDSVAIAIMISNHLVMPIVLRRRNAAREGEAAARDRTGFVLAVRRIAIIAIVLLAYIYFGIAGEKELASIGLLSFAAIAQIAPAFVGALFWSRGTARGASAGLTIGFAVWAYTLLLPSLALESEFWIRFVAEGPFGIAALRPTSLFGLDFPQLTHGVLWSLALNIAAFIGVSLSRPANAVERVQASAFAAGSHDPFAAPSLRFFRASVTVDELRATVARYLGEARTNRAFAAFLESRGQTPGSGNQADIHLLRHAEHLLASAIGTASSRLALSLLLRRRNVSTRDALRLLDDASAALQYSRDLLQNALDHAGQGITVLDRDLRIIAWNRAFVDLYELPSDFVQIGIGLEDVLRFNAERGSYGPGAIEELIAQRIRAIVGLDEAHRLRLHPSGRVIEIRANGLPNGGIVATYTDVTEAVDQEEARTRANEILESRVRERTEELTRLNEALIRAKAEADEANISKTRFLAAASHDILQPLNAARLYASALVERDRENGDAVLAEDIDASLDAVEEILTALLDISRLDTGAMKPQLSAIRADELLRQLQREFEPIAREEKLAIRVVAPTLVVHSDRRLLRRLLQNLISNALKYTPEGRVLIGARRRADTVRFEVWDTGIGIPASKRRDIFLEFHRLDQGAKVARGLGLGLSIVERIAKILDHRIEMRSVPGRGSVFTVEVPRADPRSAAVAVPEAPRQPSTPLDGLNVLAIDNEAAILEGMARLLGGWGCSVAKASSREEALAEARAAAPDIVLADFHLDEGDGLEAIGALREMLGRDLPAILITADRSPAVREAAAALGVPVLNKPLKPAALRAILAQRRAIRLAAE